MPETNTANTKPWFAGLALVALMALTRFSHFGHVLQPADASWAVFVLGGALLRTGPGFAALCAAAAGIDAVAFGLGADAACMSPAYVALLPAYGVLFAAGRWADQAARRRLARMGLAALVGTGIAFVITNLGYFAFSPSVAELRIGEFALRVTRYLPAYLTSTWLYALPLYALALHARDFRRALFARRQPG
jgi:hypothetical protein